MSTHVPFADQLQGIGFSENEIAAAFFVLFDAFTSQDREILSLFEFSETDVALADAGADAGAVADRLADRVLERSRREATGDSTMVLPLLDDDKGLEYFSALQVGCAEWFFGPLLDVTVQARFNIAFLRFANGELRHKFEDVPISLEESNIADYTNTEPDGALVVAFAEFGLVALAAGSFADFWKLALPGLIEMLDAYSDAYQPRISFTNGERRWGNYIVLNNLAADRMSIWQFKGQVAVLSAATADGLEKRMDAIAFKLFEDFALMIGS